MIEFVNKYQIYCNTENEYKTFNWPLTAGTPTTCPINPAHTIDNTKTKLFEKVNNGSIVAFDNLISLDAFGRKRISSPHDIFSSKQLSADANFFLWDTKYGNGGTSTYNKNGAETTLAVTSTLYSYSIRQTKTYHNYQPGKSQLFMFTFVMGANLSGSMSGYRKRVGCFNTNDGIYLQSMSGTVSLVIRSKASGSIVHNKINKSFWNYDCFDGTGPSKIILDFSKAQIFVIDFEWLGVGCVRCGFVIDGICHLAHIFKHSNQIANVYMNNPNLPLRYELVNVSGTGSGDSFKTICAMVASEGSTDNIGIKKAFDTSDYGNVAENLTLSSNTTLYPIIMFRLRSTHPFATIRLNNVQVIPNTTNSILYYYATIINPTITGTPTWTGMANSPLEYCNNISTSLSVTGGTKILSQYVSQTMQIANLSYPTSISFNLGTTTDVSVTDANDVANGPTVPSVSDICAICVNFTSGAKTVSFYALMLFEEIY